MDFLSGLTSVMQDVTLFSQHLNRLTLREYQRAVAQAVCRSVINNQGLSLVVMFPRQSGKNELQAQIEAYLLTLFNQKESELVKVSPTWKPQSLNAMRRLERVLRSSALLNEMGCDWQKENGYIYRVGNARIFFLSGAPEANIVGATASLLLEVDEAQDVQIDKFDRDIAPMAASTNATRVFWGTAWSSQTLLARELQAAREAEARDGQRRAFVLTADDVAREVPAYGKFVAGQVERLGRNHPMIRTQFFSEEIGAEGGMFPPERQALMRGAHARQTRPTPGEEQVTAFLLDVAGEENGAQAAQAAGLAVRSRHDATALTVVQVDLAGLEDEGLRAPVYRVLERYQWVGLAQTGLYARVTALAEVWQPRRIVVDATGIGAGLASFLEKSLPGRVVSFVFSSASKSKLGWDFLNLCDSGRFKDWQPGGEDGLQELFWRQAGACQFRLRDGPGQAMQWSVPDGMRDSLNGELLHDDLLVSAALCAVLDGQSWPSGAPAVVLRRRDPLEEMDAEGF